MKRFFAIVVLLIAQSGAAQYMWQIKKDTVVKWYYYDGDEFNGPTVDEEKWIPAYSWTNLNYDFDYLMKPERIEFSDGIAHFMCYRDSGIYKVPGWQCDSAFKKKYAANLVDRDKFKYFFTAGNVWSRKQYSKGYFEVRFKTTDSYGMWPAFWLYGSNKDEIDLMELKGEKKDEIHIDTHCLHGCDHGYMGGGIFPRSYGGWIKVSAPLAEGYNILSGEWQDGYVKYYLNGVGIGYFKGEFGSQKMNLIMGTGPAKDGKGFDPGCNETSVFPNSYDIDYTRVWYRAPTSKDGVAGQKHSTFSYAPVPEKTKAFPKKKIGFMYSKKAFKNDDITVSVLPEGNKKMLVTAVGRNINYHITFSDLNGHELYSQDIRSTFAEFDLSGSATEKVRMKIKTPFRSVEEILGLN